MKNLLLVLLLANILYFMWGFFADSVRIAALPMTR